jgi:hypothetical protein
MNMKDVGINDLYILGKNIFSLITSILITIALFASALVISALSALSLIISATAASLSTAKPLIMKPLKALVLFISIQ